MAKFSDLSTKPSQIGFDLEIVAVKQTQASFEASLPGKRNHNIRLVRVNFCFGQTNPTCNFKCVRKSMNKRRGRLTSGVSRIRSTCEFYVRMQLERVLSSPTRPNRTMDWA